MRSLWHLGGLTWKELGKRLWRDLNDDDILGRAAQLSYYFLLALFPMLLFLTALLGRFARVGSELRQNLLHYLSTVVPPSALVLIRNTLDEISLASSGSKLSFGALATLWAASIGMEAIIASLNTAFNVKETRPWWKTRMLAVALTVALSILIVSALTLILYGNTLAQIAQSRLGLGYLLTLSLQILQWPIVLAFVLFSFELIYYFAPNVQKREWHWITPGSLVGVALWLLVSFGFRIYLHFFDSYSKTYGSLGAVIILMLWFYCTGVAILIGGEVNSEIKAVKDRDARVYG